MDLIRLNVHPGNVQPRRGTNILTQLVIATPQTRIVKTTVSTSPWEVFLRPEYAQKYSIHYRPKKPQRRN